MHPGPYFPISISVGNGRQGCWWVGVGFVVGWVLVGGGVGGVGYFLFLFRALGAFYRDK